MNQNYIRRISFLLNLLNKLSVFFKKFNKLFLFSFNSYLITFNFFDFMACFMFLNYLVYIVK